MKKRLYGLAACLMLFWATSAQAAIQAVSGGGDDGGFSTLPYPLPEERWEDFWQTLQDLFGWLWDFLDKLV